MTDKDKIDLFKYELNFIQSKKIKDFVIDMLTKVPEYFFTIAASSTGKYHPSYTLGRGGLVRHTKAAVRVAHELVLTYDFNDYEKDIIYASLILHDTCKNGKVYESEFTKSTHPIDAVSLILDYYGNSNEEYVADICNCILTHMGRFNWDFKTREIVLPLPETELQNFVHLCDYIVSLRYLEYNFERD